MSLRAVSIISGLLTGFLALGCSVTPEQSSEDPVAVGSTTARLAGDCGGSGLFFYTPRNQAGNLTSGRLVTGYTDPSLGWNVLWNSTQSLDDTVAVGLNRYFDGRVLLYRPSDGAGRVLNIEEYSGTPTTVKFFGAGSFDSGANAWNQVVQTNGAFTFFYKNNGAGRLERFESDGSRTLIRAWPAGSFNTWTSIAAAKGDNGILFYNKNSATVVVGYFDAAGDLVQSAPIQSASLLSGFDRVAFDGTNHVFQKTIGSVFVATFDVATSSFTPVFIGAYGSGFDKLVGTTNGNVLMYNTSTGYACFRHYATSGSGSQCYSFSPGWSQITSAGDRLQVGLGNGC